MHDREAILKLEESMFEAIRTKDEAALRALVSSSFVFRTHTGETKDTDGFVEAILAIPVEILSIHGEHVQVDFVGDAAVLTGVQVARVRMADGAELDSRGAFADVCVRENGAWRMSIAFSVELPS